MEVPESIVGFCIPFLQIRNFTYKIFLKESICALL